MIGIIGRKIGMAQVFSEEGRLVPVTYVRCEPNTIYDVKTQDRDGYESVVLASESLEDKATKTRKFRVIREVSGDIAGAEKDAQVDVSIFEGGEKISVVGVSKGKGFQGRVRRHNARVARRTHGTKAIRHGSSGSMCITARSQKGLKMAGRMGNDQVTLHGREVVVVDADRNLVAVKGSVPGKCEFSCSFEEIVMKVVLYTQSGEKKGDVELNAELFGAEFNSGLVHLATVRQLANARQVTAKVKTRGMVRGGGRKPFKQKGTGRARQGTIRAPHMRGGGSVFGPTGRENYEKQMTRKMRRAALFSALSLRAGESQVAVVEDISLKAPSTKSIVSLLKAIGSSRKVLIVNNEKDFVLEKSIANIPGVKYLLSGYLNTVDVMGADLVLFTDSGLKKSEEIFVSKD